MRIAQAGEGAAPGALQRQGPVDLPTSEARKDNQNVALTRVEQLYPFPADAIRAAIDGYPKLREVCWVQEEPENMGAWEFVRPLLEQIIDGR